jgi:hypothetical protein
MLLVAIIMFPVLSSSISGTVELVPNENQYLEFRILEIIEDKDNPERGKQVIAGLYAYNMDFSAFDLRLGYDSSKIVLSDINTNKPLPVGSGLFTPLLIPASDVGSRIYK